MTWRCGGLCCTGLCCTGLVRAEFGCGIGTLSCSAAAAAGGCLAAGAGAAGGKGPVNQRKL